MIVTAWFLSRLHSDFWPIDKATVAPNILASVIQAAAVGLVVYLLYPRVRRAIDRWLKAHLHEHRQAMDAHLADLHRKLKHIIEHSPDIPPMKEHHDPDR
jgi:hypothetical protein